MTELDRLSLLHTFKNYFHKFVVLVEVNIDGMFLVVIMRCIILTYLYPSLFVFEFFHRSNVSVVVHLFLRSLGVVLEIGGRYENRFNFLGYC